jgi:hypothetical protein
MHRRTVLGRPSVLKHINCCSIPIKGSVEQHLLIRQPFEGGDE